MMNLEKSLQPKSGPGTGRPNLVFKEQGAGKRRLAAERRQDWAIVIFVPLPTRRRQAPTGGGVLSVQYTYLSLCVCVNAVLREN